MKHKATPRFWQCYGALAEEARRAADASHELMVRDPRHPSVQLKRIGTLWSARAGLRFRALAAEVESDGEIELVWFWIGSHADYDRLISQR